MTKENEIIDYPKGVTFEQVWATIQEFGKKYDAIFEREAKERKEREEREEREAKERREREEREAKERREREEREAKERQEREEREAKERQEWLKAEEERQKKADKRMRKLEANVDKTTLSVDRLSKNMGGLNNSFGEMVEHLVAPNIVSKFNELGYHFKKVSKRTEFFENGQVVTEVDLLLENEKTIAIIEIKSSPTTDDIEKHLKRMQIVRRDFERSRDTPKELIGAVAGAIFPDNIKRLAIKNGFYVITQTDDTVKIDVPENFKPKIF